MNTKIVRLNSGEEILCDLEMDGTDYLLKKPLIIIPTNDGQIGFVSWLPYADTREGVKIPESFVAFTIDPDGQLDSEYKNHTSSIIVPEKKMAVAGPSLKLTE